MLFTNIARCEVWHPLGAAPAVSARDTASRKPREARAAPPGYDATPYNCVASDKQHYGFLIDFLFVFVFKWKDDVKLNIFTYIHFLLYYSIRCITLHCVSIIDAFFLSLNSCSSFMQYICAYRRCQCNFTILCRSIH